MVAPSSVQHSNTLIRLSLPSNLVGVFVGGTSGIGETTLKQFAKHADKLRIYFVGRSQDAANRIIAECRILNAGGQYVFIKADVSSIKAVDEVCGEIRAKEKAVNILFLSQGVLTLNRKVETAEGLPLVIALAYYSRFRFVQFLLPVLRNGQHLRRVVTVAAGGYEGPVDIDDLSARRAPLTAIRGHAYTMTTLALEAVAAEAPDVNFVHDYPGVVNTPLINQVKGMLGVIARTVMFLLGWFVAVPIIDEEKGIFLATSARYSPLGSAGGVDDGLGVGVPLVDSIEVAVWSNGEIGSGVYSAGQECDSIHPKIIKLLRSIREKGTSEKSGSTRKKSSRGSQVPGTVHRKVVDFAIFEDIDIAGVEVTFRRNIQQTEKMDNILIFTKT